MSRAAQALHVTQPTLSRQMADLERELGCELLVRGSRTVTPTEKGLYLRRRAEEIVALADQTTFDLRRDDDVIEGDVSIGAGESEGMRRGRRPRSRVPRAAPARALPSAQRQQHQRGRMARARPGGLRRPYGVPGGQQLRARPPGPRPTRGACSCRRNTRLAQADAIAPQDLANCPLILSEQALETDELSQWFGDLAQQVEVAATYNLVFNARAARARERRLRARVRPPGAHRRRNRPGVPTA